MSLSTRLDRLEVRHVPAEKLPVVLFSPDDLAERDYDEWEAAQAANHPDAGQLLFVQFITPASTTES